MAKLIGFVVVVVYIWGLWKFWTGYNQTSFSHNLPNRMVLSLFWPVFLVANQGYRQNFQKALRGRR
jgi:hypothetical protein